MLPGRVVIDFSRGCPPRLWNAETDGGAGWSSHSPNDDGGRVVGHRRVQLDGSVELGHWSKLIGLAADSAGAEVLRSPPAPCRLEWPQPTTFTTL